MADATWSKYAWKSFQSESESVGWQKHLVPYTEDANALQTVDIWLPQSKELSEAPASDSLPCRAQAPWVIYIHGGAWRDPLVSAYSFEATAKHLLPNKEAAKRIGGLASLNYSLSPHPQHPTHPAPPKDPSEPQDPSRQAKHPDHIKDVLQGLAFLQQKAKFGSNYVLIGHSCGATLALQVAMNAQTWDLGDETPKAIKPEVIVGLNGLYDLPTLIKEPGDKHKHLVPIYDAFTKLAFGEDEQVWQQVSPISVPDWTKQWGVGSRMVFAQSKDDSLVPYRQTSDMMEALKASKALCLKISEEEISGDHNEIWQKGDRLAEILQGIVEGM